MARIRSVYPEFFDSDDTATLSPLAALTYTGLWIISDDEGRGRASVGFIHRRLHAGRKGISEQDTQAALDEIAGRDLILYYQGEGGAPLYFIPSFKKHQRPKYPTPSKLPPPPEGLRKGSPRTPEGLPPVVESGSGSRVGVNGGTAPPAAEADPAPAKPAKQRPGSSPEAILVSHWNADENRAPIGLDAGVRQIKVAVAAGVKLVDIETAIWDATRCSGRKLFDILDEMKPDHKANGNQKGGDLGYVIDRPAR